MLKKMLYVYTVYEEKSFSKAAKRLFVSQPSLSAMVKKVESDYDITIFDRTTTPISLTPEGEYYISAAKKILRLDADMRQHFRECSKGLNGSVMFGGASFFCANMLSGIIRQFQSEYPDIHIGWQELRNDELASQILQKKIDFAFEVDKIETDGITSLKFDAGTTTASMLSYLTEKSATFVTNAHLRSCCFRPGDMSNGVHSIYEAEPIDVGLFRDVPFVFLREGNDSYSRGIQICKNAGFTPNIIMQVDSSMTTYHLAAAGNGAAFIRISALSIEASGKLCYFRIADPLNVRDIFLYYRAAGRSRVEETLLAFIRDMVGGVQKIE